MSISLEDTKSYLHIDYIDEDIYLTQLIEVVQIYIDSMVGEYYKTDEKAVKLAELLQKKLLYDMYENRGTEISTMTKKDIIVTSILDKLSLYEDVTII